MSLTMPMRVRKWSQELWAGTTCHSKEVIGRAGVLRIKSVTGWLADLCSESMSVLVR